MVLQNRILDRFFSLTFIGIIFLNLIFQWSCHILKFATLTCKKQYERFMKYSKKKFQRILSVRIVFVIDLI